MGGGRGCLHEAVFLWLHKLCFCGYTSCGYTSCVSVVTQAVFLWLHKLCFYGYTSCVSMVTQAVVTQAVFPWLQERQPGPRERHAVMYYSVCGVCVCVSLSVCAQVPPSIVPMVTEVVFPW